MRRSLFYLLILLSTQLSYAGDTFYRHIPGVFIGYTHVEGGDTDFTWGLEYEYKFTPNWGLGALYEKLPDAHDGDGIDIKLVELFYHPGKGNSWRFGAGLGQEKIYGKKPKTKDLYRLSVAYDFHVGDFGIAPTLDFDFIESEKSIVFGLTIVRPF